MAGLVLTVAAWVPAVALPILALIAGGLVYLDARLGGRERAIAAMPAFIVTGLLLAGSVPSLVALVLADIDAVQGFPTALRIVPGLVAIGVYLVFRRA